MGFRQKSVLSIFFGERDLTGEEKAGLKAGAGKEVIKEGVKSEILRGDAAIFEVTLKAGVDLNQGAEGIFSVINENKQKKYRHRTVLSGSLF